MAKRNQRLLRNDDRDDRRQGNSEENSPAFPVAWHVTPQDFLEPNIAIHRRMVRTGKPRGQWPAIAHERPFSPGSASVAKVQVWRG